MKVCKYCNKENKDENLNCDSCGANGFNYKCNNCKTLFDTAFCPTCGIKADEKPKICKRCGTKSFELFCPKCGTDLMNTYNDTNDNYNNISIEIETIPEVEVHKNNYRKKNKGCLIFILIVFIFSVLMAITYNTGDVNYDNTTTSESSNNTAVESDLDIITKEGHPLFYDNYKDAKDFWKGYNKVKVVNAHSTIYNEDALLLITTNDKDNGIITNISFNFSDVQDKDKLTVDEVLKIVCTYIPYDIFNKYYDYKTSFKETYKREDRGYVAYHYIMALNENGKKLKDANYNSTFAFKIYCSDKNKWSSQISPLAANGNSEKASFDVEKWKVDLKKVNNLLKNELDDIKAGAGELYNQANTYYKKKSYDRAKEVISNLCEKYPDSNEAKKAKQLLSTINNEIKKDVEKAEMKKIEEEKKRLAAATKKMRKSYDEVQEITWYYDKSSAQYVNQNNFYIYIGTKKDGSAWLRLKIQYAAANWIFINQYIFKVDEKTFEINAGEFGVERDNNGGGIWEVYDIDLNKDNYEMVKAIISSKKTIIRHQGDEHYADRVITAKEKQGLQNVLDTYEALGGKLSF